MKCNGCKYYSEVVVSFMDSSNVETDLGLSNIECLKQKEELITKQLLNKNKGKKTCIIGLIKKFDCDKSLKHLIPNIKILNTPDWCPDGK